MKYLYFDLIDGISGDMIVASLLDLSGNFNYLKSELKKINLREYELKSFKCQAGHIKAFRFVVKDSARTKRVFQFKEIKNKINGSKLDSQTKKNILDVYNTLYNAEKNVHDAKHAHFEQLGEVDSIIDIAASCILINKLNVDRILYSSVPFGEKVAPATAYMLKSKNIRLSQHQYENITPTGIAIITTLGSQMQKDIKYSFILQKSGCGTGSIASTDCLNILRTAILQEEKKTNLEQDEILVMQCNIDDMSPQILGFLMDKLYQAGALEVYFQNYHTKKSRSGILISVLSRYETFDTIARIIFRQTTTLGLRYFKADRIKLKRRQGILNSSIGKVRFKEVTDKKYNKIIPEYDDCVKIANSRNIALKDVIAKFSKGE
ncbi:MAG: LarC family nickel insertion protein [Candidatus Omnitrophica bacterium]|nr:LarC family nickel insertion protein [Candidatus Omnitrophota bacterium]MDD5352574.1 LarC family nickel insertion protein [Candidatus Omnitrophota bacterium]MDD5550172.1 LarC family nickel insertion protein [Candidatus Omnitrophota bacterium]